MKKPRKNAIPIEKIFRKMSSKGALSCKKSELDLAKNFLLELQHRVELYNECFDGGTDLYTLKRRIAEIKAVQTETTKLKGMK